MVASNPIRAAGLAICAAVLLGGGAPGGFAARLEAGGTGAHDPGLPVAPDLLSLELGTPRSEVETRLAAWSLRPIAGADGSLRIEQPVLDPVYEQQRSLLDFDIGGRLAAIDIQVVPDGGSSGADVLLLYGDVKAELIRRLGSPAWERAEGAARSGGTLRAIGDGTLIRYLQWEGDRSVRAGIPRRVDGEIVVEVLVTARRIPRSETFWGRRY